MKAIIKKVTKGKHKGEFRFILVAANHEPVAQSWSESYASKEMCVKTLKKYFPNFEIIDQTI